VRGKGMLDVHGAVITFGQKAISVGEYLKYKYIT